jgi:hypothetical protein
MATPNIFRRILVFGLITFGMLTFASSIIAYLCLSCYGPRQPNVATGQIYPMRMQQPFDVFLTKFQIEWVQDGPFLGMGVGIAACFLNTRWKIVHNPYDDIPKKLY